jgi:hypothetical protein
LSYTPPESFQTVTPHKESCAKCRGTGQWRPGYPCFACKGQGYRTFKTAAPQRAQARTNAANRKAVNKAESIAAFRAEHPKVAAWLDAPTTFAFALAMRDSLAQWGGLTDNQIAACYRCIEGRERAQAQRATVAANAPAIDVSKLEAAFAAARASAKSDGEGVKWLKLRLGTFTFSDAPARAPYPAAIFVKEGTAKLGRIVGGKFLRSYGCDDATQSRIIAAASDPLAAALAYGLRTSRCSCCGAELTNAESRRLGIGPICRARWFAG